MTRDELLIKPCELKPWLAEQGIVNVRLFGSHARDEAGPDSDMDLLVEVTRPLDFRFFGVERELSSTLGVPVDLGTKESLYRLVRRQAMRDLVHV